MKKLLLLLSIPGCLYAMLPEQPPAKAPRTTQTPVVPTPFTKPSTTLSSENAIDVDDLLWQQTTTAPLSHHLSQAEDWTTIALGLINKIFYAKDLKSLFSIEDDFIRSLPQEDSQSKSDLLSVFCQTKDMCYQIIKTGKQEQPIERPELPPHTQIFNYARGQYDILNTDGQASYRTACAAMATAAVIILGGQLSQHTPFESLSDEEKTQLMENILTTGATVYDATPDKDEHGFAKADTVAPLIISSQPQNVTFTVNDELVLSTHVAIQSLLPKDDYTPDKPFRTILQIMQAHTDHNDGISATGVTLSNGTVSRAVLYIRGDSPENSRFVLYDSHHITLLGDYVQGNGSFVASAPDIDTIISIADNDGRWPTRIENRGEATDFDILKSLMFIEIRR